MSILKIVETKDFLAFQKRILEKTNELKEARKEQILQKKKESFFDDVFAEDLNNIKDNDDLDDISEEELARYESLLSEEDYLEESVASKLGNIVKSKKADEIEFQNGTSTDVSPKDAEKILAYMNKLSKSKKTEFAGLINKSAKTFMIARDMVE